MKMKVNSIIVLLTLCLLVTACRRHAYHDLEQVQAGSLRIEFDWNGYTDIPPGMNLMFYPVEGLGMEEPGYAGRPIKHQLQYDGGVVSLPVGCYNVAVYNDYTYQILYRGMDTYHTAEAWLEDYDRLPLSSRAIGTRNVAEPDIFYVTRLEGLQVTAYDEDRTITLRPELKTLKLFIHVSIDGLHNVSMADGGISGIGSSLMLSTGEATDNTPYNRLFPFSVTDEGLYAETRTFLLPNRAEDCTYTLELAFLLRNNSVSMGKYAFDVSSQIVPVLQQREGRIPPEGIHIYLHDVVVDEVASSGGFDAVVDQWGDEVNIELK